MTSGKHSTSLKMLILRLPAWLCSATRRNLLLGLQGTLFSSRAAWQEFLQAAEEEEQWREMELLLAPPGKAHTHHCPCDKGWLHYSVSSFHAFCINIWFWLEKFRCFKSSWVECPVKFSWQRCFLSDLQPNGSLDKGDKKAEAGEIKMG